MPPSGRFVVVLALFQLRTISGIGIRMRHKTRNLHAKPCHSEPLPLHRLLFMHLKACLWHCVQAGICFDLMKGSNRLICVQETVIHEQRMSGTPYRLHNGNERFGEHSIILRGLLSFSSSSTEASVTMLLSRDRLVVAIFLSCESLARFLDTSCCTTVPLHDWCAIKISIFRFVLQEPLKRCYPCRYFLKHHGFRLWSLSISSNLWFASHPISITDVAPGYGRDMLVNLARPEYAWEVLTRHDLQQSCVGQPHVDCPYFAFLA